MSYSPFLHTLYDEGAPVGNLGRGTHYSVLRAVTWHDTFLNPLQTAAFIDFALVWDEDHDVRVIEVIHSLYFGGLLAPVRFVAERKGTLFVLLAPEVVIAWDVPVLARYRERVADLVSLSSKLLGDSWPVTVDSADGDALIIGADRGKVDIYLRCVQMLWGLGVKSRPVAERTAAD